jgi:cytochrome P450
MSEHEVTLEDLLAGGPMAPIANPFPLYRKLRDESPVAPMRNAGDPLDTQDGPGNVMITRYEDVKNALKDDDSF